MFLLHGRLTVGTFTRRGLAASSLYHCGFTGPHPSHRRLLVASFYVGKPYSATIPLDPGCFTKNLWDSPMLAWLLHCLRTTRCCLRPRGVGNTLVISVLPVSPAPYHRGSAHSQNSSFSGLRGRFRAHTLHLVVLANLWLNIESATGWLTRPCPGGPVAYAIPLGSEPLPG